jgi:hypothetical protein
VVNQVWFAKALFAASGWAFGLMVKAARSEESKEAFRARYAPMNMLKMPFA